MLVNDNNLDKISFNVLGSCVSRDTLDFKNKKYNVLKYAAFFSPYTMLNGHPLNIDFSLFDDLNLAGIYKRGIYLDCNNSIFEYIAEGISDWLLLDVAPVRIDIVKWTGHNVVLTYSGPLKCTLDKLQSVIGEEQPEVLSSWKIPDNELYKNLDKVIDGILALYNPEQIILSEFYGVQQYIGNKGELKCFNEAARNIVLNQNKIIKKTIDYYKRKLKGCHNISPPDNLLACEWHRWGLYQLHYHDFYYEYAEKCVDIITQKLERSEEERQIEYLRQLYSEKFAVLREKAAHKSTALDRDKWRTYSDTFKQIINSNQLEYGEDIIKNIERAFLSKGHRRIAIYGDTEITKVLCNVLGGGTNISIKYIVEDSKNPVKGFKTIDRNPANYPDCDVMLIADIYRYNEIEAKLKKLQLPFPFYNAAEYIKSLPAGSGDGMQKIKDKIEMLNGKDAALTKGKAEYTAKYERTYGELQAIKNSLSFKVGRMITFIPRKLRNALKRKK